MAEKTKQPGRVKHDRGLADFFALGPDRSLGKLYDRYTKSMLKPPALIRAYPVKADTRYM